MLTQFLQNTQLQEPKQRRSVPPPLGVRPPPTVGANVWPEDKGGEDEEAKEEEEPGDTRGPGPAE